MDARVVIIGGGPAGLAAAIAFARHAILTVVVERDVLPRDKPCGEGLLPGTLAALMRLGIPISDLSREGDCGLIQDASHALRNPT